MAVGLVLKGKKVAVAGAGAGTPALIRYLLKRGAEVTLVDERARETVINLLGDKVDASKFRLEAGQGYAPAIFEGAEWVLLSASAARLPDPKLLEPMRANGVQIASEVEFLSLFVDEPVFAVVGTKGKTTTANLIGRMLELAGKKAFPSAGQLPCDYLNVAKPVDALLLTADAPALEFAATFKPQVLVLTNIFEDHLDRYLTFDHYAAPFANAIRNLDAESLLVYNRDDVRVATLAASVPTKKRALSFGLQEVPEGSEGAWATKTHLYLRVDGAKYEFDIRNVRLRGSHNRENLMAAALAAIAFGAKPDTVGKLIEIVSALPGRMEFVRRLNSVAFYNDACSTNPSAVIRSLQAFHEPVILIMGGRDKNVDFTALTTHVRHRVKNLILVGEGKEKINRALGDFTETFLVGTLEEGVLMAYQKSRSGDVVLYSPGCDSHDLFEAAEARGDAFRSLVNQIAQPRKPAYL